MNDLLKWYMEYDNYTEDERNCLRIARQGYPEQVSDKEYNALCQKYFDLMPFCNISTENRFLTFDESGTFFIDKVFTKEVDDDTLVISTTYEHGSVQKQLAIVKNKILLDSEKEIRAYNFKRIEKELPKYKKVFVYIIGTQLSTGEITPQAFFEELKKLLVKYKVEHKIFIDDVHGMFLVPRDYSMFDYVLYTAHSLVREYDMGVFISKDGKYGKKAYNWGLEYLEKLSIILKHKQKMNMFKNIMLQVLNKLISDVTTFRLYSQTVDHIFAVETNGILYTEEEWNKLDSYYIRVSEHSIYKSWIRIRFQEFSRLPIDKALEGLEYLYKLLDKKIMLKKLKEG